MNTTLSLLNIVFVIGGPGVGKGTLCSLLEQEWPTKLIHIRLGDILRAEREKPESQWADVLQKNLREGRIGSKEMVIQLLGDRLDELAAQDKQKVILLDGQYVLRGSRDGLLGSVQAFLGLSTDVCSLRTGSAIR